MRPCSLSTRDVLSGIRRFVVDCEDGRSFSVYAENRVRAAFKLRAHGTALRPRNVREESFDARVSVEDVRKALGA